MLRLIPCIVLLARSGSAFAQEPSAAGGGLHPRIKFETSLGDIVLELDGEKAPITVQNFVQYVESGFYNGTIFHRIIPTFMIQGGGMTQDGKDKKEGLRPPIKNESGNGLKNVRGSISMARTQALDSATSQFFINVADNASLDSGRYAVFGKVVDGIETVDKIKNAEVSPTPNAMGEKATPATPIVIKSATIVGQYDKRALAAKAGESDAAARDAQAKVEAARRAGAAKTPADIEKDIEAAVARVEGETKQKVSSTDSGVRYVVLKEGGGASPQPASTVTVHYAGWLHDGTKFDSSVDKGKPYTLPLSNFVPGFSQGVGMMKVGEKRKLIVPPQLAYGVQGYAPLVPPNATLIFEVELLEVK